MENMHTITLASRIRVGKENKGALYNVLISLIFFLSDLILDSMDSSTTNDNVIDASLVLED